MGSTTDIRKGTVIKHQGELYVVSAFQFVNPGKGSAFTKTKMKGIKTGKTIEITYKSGESVETVDVEHQNMQYLYKSGDFYSFMNKDSYETADVSPDTLGESAPFLKEGMDTVAIVYEGAVVAMELPKKATYTVASAPPAEKGDTAGGNVTKEIELENGLKIQAPIFIKEGDQVIVNTETGIYDSRTS